jgi:hypothetical protein
MNADTRRFRPQMARISQIRDEGICPRNTQNTQNTQKKEFNAEKNHEWTPMNMHPAKGTNIFKGRGRNGTARVSVRPANWGLKRVRTRKAMLCVPGEGMARWDIEPYRSEPYQSRSVKVTPAKKCFLLLAKHARRQGNRVNAELQTSEKAASWRRGRLARTLAPTGGRQSDLVKPTAVQLSEGKK